MKFNFYLFILLFFFFKNIQIECENGIAKTNLDNIREEKDSDKISLSYGEIQEEFITFRKPKSINIDDGNLKTDLLVHIFSINCKIQVDLVNSKDSKLLNNLDNESYLIKIIKNDSDIQINLSLNQNNEDINNRKCPLVINSMYDKKYKLTVKEHNPTIFFFDENLMEINLKYNLNDFTDDSYVVFSFLFNEKASFEINIEEDIEFNKIRKISNSHNVFLTKKSFLKKGINSLNINVRKIGEYNKLVLLTFRVISEKFTPLIIQKNHLNQGFIASNINYQHYYMEVFKNEEGEIIWHDKRQNGKLIGRICKNKTNCPINKNYSFIEDDNYLEYKEHFRKLKFNYTHTQECDGGCYLLISYYHDTLGTINNIIIGFEFTLLTRIWDKVDWSKTSIVNIPNNEYIFGYFEKNSINHHYYSILICNGTQLILEIKGKNYKFFYGEGKTKLNTYNSFLDNTHELIIENEMEMEIIDYPQNRSKYLSFAVKPNNFFDDIDSFYYFRIFQIENTDNLIMPFDSNIENNCKKLNNNISLKSFICTYLLNNDYNDFYLNFTITPSSIIQNQMSSYQLYQSEKTESLDIREDTLKYLIIFDKKSSIHQNIIRNIRILI